MRTHKHRLHHHPITQPSQRSGSGLQLETWHRRVLYVTFITLFATGLGWLLAHFFLQVQTEFGPSIHPVEPLSMKMHGAAAMLALFFVGSLLNIHIRRALSVKRNQDSGWSLIVILSALTLTGYVLYYLSSETSRPIWSVLHWSIGLLLPVALTLHVSRGRNWKKPVII
ncbi:DUF4405 domain-containing protein [Ampullimonas aquatilis]|uniref:DUF4405 domain-containing protein n=1 Tax=Ampullimonas aquatilis TaxID=1341549 RepID=UPI003C795F8F